ncbi:hypothetical protein P3T76_014934 [Phytophthora citrophthora]|uniref:Uncharacterized protein n=1 Tax=Phytophthora citrophthora TaxID=4793 RepID=A0AAD9G031_9STRA|nr:hypothetical protein P3T76_014934 [Phytophthora citrophthora]
MKSVWVFSDDGEDELVNAVVPGFGHCLVERGDLTFLEHANEQLSDYGPSSLTIQFKTREEENETEDDDNDNGRERVTHVNHNGLFTFIEKIGPSLKNLTLDSPRTKM